MTLTILSVAFPLSPVSADAAGGAEQVLHQVDRHLVHAGHRSRVVACAGSEVAGSLLATPAPPSPIDDEAWRAAHAAVRRRIAEALEDGSVNLLHFHGVDCLRYMPPPKLPTLVTLHLPAAWYPPEILCLEHANLAFNFVSTAQRASFPAARRRWPVIANGVALAPPQRPRRRRYVAMLGRICPEKGFHLGLDAAQRAGVPSLLAGAVFGYPAHQRYFREEIAPRLDRRRRFIGVVGGSRKRRFLASALCLLVPSLAPETSSLVAMEALACGTPVVAFPSGALPEIVDPGRTGFIVRDLGEMAEAIVAAARLSAEDCRAAARERFSAARMVGQYLDYYRELATRR